MRDGRLTSLVNDTCRGRADAESGIRRRGGGVPTGEAWFGDSAMLREGFYLGCLLKARASLERLNAYE